MPADGAQNPLEFAESLPADCPPRGAGMGMFYATHGSNPPGPEDFRTAADRGVFKKAPECQAGGQLHHGRTSGRSALTAGVSGSPSVLFRRTAWHRSRRCARDPDGFLAVAPFILAAQGRDDAGDLCYTQMMPLWDVKLPRWNGGNFSTVTPLEVLVELDEPLTFTFTDSNGSLMLAHLCFEGMDRLRYIVAPTSQRILHELKTGIRSIQQAMDQPIVWLLDVGSDATVVDAWVTTHAGLPDNVIPAADVMLYAWLGPAGQGLARRVS